MILLPIAIHTIASKYRKTLQKFIFTFSVYSSSPLYRIISGAIKPSVPPNPFVPDGKVRRLIPETKKQKLCGRWELLKCLSYRATQL
jgi:hypothetical protein